MIDMEFSNGGPVKPVDDWGGKKLGRDSSNSYMVTPAVFASLMILMTALMGSAFSIGKIGLAYVSPLLLVAIRFLLAGMFMAILVIHRPHPHRIQDWIRIAIIGFFQTAGVMGCIFISLRTITAAESSILTFTNPLLVVIFGTFFLGARYRIMQWLGVVLGLFGVFFTLDFQFSLKIGTVLALGGAVSWTIAVMLIKRWSPRFDIWVLTAYQMLLGGVMLLVASAAIEQPILHVTGMSVFIILWLAIMASVVQFAIWFYLLQRGDPGKTSAFLFLVPFFGVISGWILLGERIRWPVLVGGAVICLGIFLVNWPRGERVESATPTHVEP